MGSTGESSGSELSATAFTATIKLSEGHSAVATATFTEIEYAVHVDSHLRGRPGQKTTEQALAANGTLQFDTGDTFVMDAENCRANTFDNHTHSNASSGPKPGAAPSNDTPDGAIRLTTKSKAEPPDRRRCRAGRSCEHDVSGRTVNAMGHTVWYTVIGTGRPNSRIDTSASNFDTVVAAYVLTAGEHYRGRLCRRR